MDAKGMNHSNRTSEIQVQHFASSSFSFFFLLAAVTVK